MGVLFVNFLYLIVFVTSLYCIYLAVYARKKSSKILFVLGAAVGFGLLLTAFILTQQKHRKLEVLYVGKYMLTEYPNCSPCILMLDANSTYKVVEKGAVKEEGEWHLETGDDYFILYLDHKNHRLGSGKFAYSDSQNGFDKE